MSGLAYNDPAFSSDPHAHPFLASPWSFNPDHGSRPLQPHNGPMLSDDHSSTTHDSSSSSCHTSTTLSTPPTSTDSHSPSSTPTSEKNPHLRWPPEVQKKKKSLAMFWRRTPPETVLASVDLTRNVSPDASPPRNMIPAANRRPAPPHNVTTPSANVSSTRPILPRRPATSPDCKPPPPTSRRIAGTLTMRENKLDRIDELDESNPIGLPLHHGGPYEAAHNPTSQEVKQNNVPHNIGSLYQRSHRHNISDVTSVPIVPAGVSLNLSPGQILPSNFYHQVDPHMSSTTVSANAPGWPPKPHNPHSQHGRSQSQPQFRPHLSPAQNISTNHDDKHLRFDGSLLRNAPPEYSSLPKNEHYGIKDSPTFFAPTFNYEGEEISYYLDDRKHLARLAKEQQQLSKGPPVNILVDSRAPNPGPRHHHQSHNNRLPPRMQALQMQVPRSDEKRRRSRPPIVNHDHAAPPVGGTIPIQVGHLNQFGTPPIVDNIRQVPLFVDNNGLPASAPAPSSFEIVHAMQDQGQPYDILQPLPGVDNRSGRSIHNGSKPTISGYPNDAPLPHHLPKRLVMPAPLQTTQPVAARRQSQPEPPPRHLGHQPWQPQLRTPSPLYVPAALDPYTESQLRAEDNFVSGSQCDQFQYPASSASSSISRAGIRNAIVS
ncbi:hypothetical protein C0992_013124 [Termitomyces sp. T32_za158]|nr:hypothetical protein C0992_013124 [Termitomyces sp. T32_za158]